MNTNKKMRTYSTRIRFDADSLDYEVGLKRKKKQPWWLLGLLLLFLLFLLLLRINPDKDFAVRVVDEADRPLPGTTVLMQYRGDFLYKDHAFFRRKAYTQTLSTGPDGACRFDPVGYSVYSFVFYPLKTLSLVASNEDYEGMKDVRFHFLLNHDTIVMKIKEKRVDFTIVVQDAVDRSVLPGSPVRYTWRHRGQIYEDSLLTDERGEAVIRDLPVTSVLTGLHASHPGYSDGICPPFVDKTTGEHAEFPVRDHDTEKQVVLLQRPLPCSDGRISSKDDQANAGRIVKEYSLGRREGEFVFEYRTQKIPDRFLIYNCRKQDVDADTAPLFDSGTVSTGDRFLREKIRFTSEIVTVVAISGDSGTYWECIVHCPEDEPANR